MNNHGFQLIFLFVLYCAVVVGVEFSAFVLRDEPRDSLLYCSPGL